MAEAMSKLHTRIPHSTERSLDLLMAASGASKASVVNAALSLGLLNLGAAMQLPDLPVLRHAGRPPQNQED